MLYNNQFMELNRPRMWQTVLVTRCVIMQFLWFSYSHCLAPKIYINNSVHNTQTQKKKNYYVLKIKIHMFTNQIIYCCLIIYYILVRFLWTFFFLQYFHYVHKKAFILYTIELATQVKCYIFIHIFCTQNTRKITFQIVVCTVYLQQQQKKSVLQTCQKFDP